MVFTMSAHGTFLIARLIRRDDFYRQSEDAEASRSLMQGFLMIDACLPE